MVLDHFEILEIEIIYKVKTGHILRHSGSQNENNMHLSENSKVFSPSPGFQYIGMSNIFCTTL